MTLVESRQEGRGVTRNQLVTCPACGADLSQLKHTHTHIEEHVPEDFGLSPIGRESPFHVWFVLPEPSTVYLLRSGGEES